jgi:apolipoprotein N-acyltransferase
MRYLLIAISFLLVSFGQPAWIREFSPLVATLGFALFWKGMLSFEGSRRQFSLAWVWFTFVQLIQLSWMSTTDYMGPFILLVYGLLSLSMGLQFGLLSVLIGRGPLDLRRALGIAGMWVILEWVRLFPCTGFTWNPVGLAWTGTNFSFQAAALLGIYGLSFWVIFVNLAALRASMLRTKAAFFTWATLALLPFVFGVVYQSAVLKGSGKKMSVLLVQTALLPHERDYYPERPKDWVPPLVQWKRILNLIEHPNNGRGKSFNLLVLPEAAMPFTAFQPVYPLSDFLRIWSDVYGREALNVLPPVEPLSDKELAIQDDDELYVSNAYWIQALADHYDCEVVAGLNDWDANKTQLYNAAFHFLPNEQAISRYEKRVLVPVGEYVPLKSFSFLSRFIADQFGISSSFQPGTEAKVFAGRANIGISICYEETYSETIRDLSKKGADLFVNLSNDGWFPRSKLSQQHFDHGIVRAVENGIPSVRSCSTGITGGVDCFGRVIATLPTAEAGALFLEVPLQTSLTPYSIFGNSGILFLSLCAMLSLFFRKNASCPK